MADSDPPWEPPLAGTEIDHVVGALDRLRTTFRWKADDLDAAGLGTRIAASALTLGNLLKHLALQEDITFTWKLRGAKVGGPWTALGWDGAEDWEFRTAPDDAPEALYGLWDDAVERSRARLVEEYGRHTGHVDLIREAVDGRVGEDPPFDWRPRSGRARSRE